MKRPWRPRSLRARITLWLLAFATALTLALVAQGAVVIEYVERIVWQSLLTTELDRFIAHGEVPHAGQGESSRGVTIHVGAPGPGTPPELRGLDEGLHDDLRIGDSRHVVLVRDRDGTRYTLAMDIEAFAVDEAGYERMTLLAAAALLLVVGLATALGVRRLLRPLSRLAERIGGMRPERADGRVELEPGAGSELLVIADAFNSYLARNEQFIERERNFINTASHELRTPVAVISGAAALALQPGTDRDTMERQLRRIQRSARDMEQLATLLLALAKDPARLVRAGKPVALDTLLPQVVEDHRHLVAAKDLRLRIGSLPRCDIHAPDGIVRAAIGNLLRNAIENSDDGEIAIELQADATVVIRDPGRGMTPEQVSAIYSNAARNDALGGDSGIGLALIARLCEHFGWRLELQSGPGHGTTAVLRFRAAAPVDTAGPATVHAPGRTGRT